VAEFVRQLGPVIFDDDAGPVQIPLFADGAARDLTGYDAVAIAVWEQRTRIEIAAPGSVALPVDLTTGIITWTPTAASFDSGAYEMMVRISTDGGTSYEPAGLYRFTAGDGPSG
jgi:hypothetical protein